MLQNRWNGLMDRLRVGAALASEVYSIIYECYTAADRYYHTMAHLEKCFTEFDKIANYLSSKPEVELALWFHDLIQIPKGKSNEELSSIISFGYTWELTGDIGMAAKVQQIVKATAHQSGSEIQDLDTAYLLDIDLAILGTSPVEYAVYEANIRREYGYLEAGSYRLGRCQVLQGFLNQTHIYRTPYFREIYEKPARVNIAKQISLLTAYNGG